MEACREKLETLKPLLACISGFVQRHHIQTKDVADEILLEMRASMILSASFAEGLKGNFDERGCKCEMQEMHDGRIQVSFDKAYAATLQALHDSFPTQEFPFEEWGKQAEEMGEENPLKAEVETRDTKHSRQKLEDYLAEHGNTISGGSNSVAKANEQAEPKKTGKVTFSQKDRKKAKAQIDDMRHPQQKKDQGRNDVER